MGSEVFVGRRAELSRASDALAAAARGTAQVVVVVGEPGIGKTSFARVVADRAPAGSIVLYGGCDERGLPYQPMAEACAQLIRENESLVGSWSPEIRAQLGTLVPRADLGGDVAGVAAGDPEMARYRFFTGIANALGAAARRAPLVLVLDDLQWADASTRQLIRHSMARLVGDPVMFLVTARDTDLDTDASAWLADLHRDNVVTKITLRGMSTDEVAELLGPPRADVDRVVEITGGNPFFVVQVADQLNRSPSAEGGGEVPEAVRDLVGQRLFGLGDATLEALRAAAVVGHEFEFAVVAAVVERDPDAVLELFEAVLGSGLITEIDHERFAFAHAIVRQAVIAELSATRRALLHARIADVLDATADVTGAAAMVVARHDLAANLPGRREMTIDRAIRAADAAMRLHAYPEALELVESAAGIAAEDARLEHKRLELLLRLGWATFMGRSWAASSEPLLYVIREGCRLRRPEIVAEAAASYTQSLPSGYDPELTGLLVESLSHVERGDERTRCLLLAQIAGHQRGDPEQTRALSLEALAMARASGDPSLVAFALHMASNALAHTPLVQERIELAREQLSVAAVGIENTAVGIVAGPGSARRLLGRCLLQAGDGAGFEEQLEAMTEEAEATADPIRLEIARGWQRVRALYQGRFDDCEAAIREASASGRMTPFLLLHLLLLRVEQGRSGEIRGAVESIQRSEAIVVAAVPRVRLDAGDREGAKAALDDLVGSDFAPISPDGSERAALCWLAHVAAAVGHRAAAVPLYDRLACHGGQLGLLANAGLVGAVDRFCGELAFVLDRFDDAERHFEAALEIETGLGAPPLVARTHVAFARLLLARGGAGDVARATALLTDASAVADRLGMVSLRAEIAELQTLVAGI